jgi:hypothetical protein
LLAVSFEKYFYAHFPPAQTLLHKFRMSSSSRKRFGPSSRQLVAARPLRPQAQPHRPGKSAQLSYQQIGRIGNSEQRVIFESGLTPIPSSRVRQPVY